MNAGELDAKVPGFNNTCRKSVGPASAPGEMTCTHRIPDTASMLTDALTASSSAARSVAVDRMNAAGAEENKYPQLKTFANRPVRVFTIRKRDDTVASISLSLDTSSWPIVALALTEKYGTPFSKESGTVQNRAGATFDQEKMEWRNGDQYVIAEKRTSQLDTMSIELRSDKGDAETVEAVKNTAKKGAKDL